MAKDERGRPQAGMGSGPASLHGHEKDSPAVNPIERLRERTTIGEFQSDAEPLASEEVRPRVMEALRRSPSIDVSAVLIRGGERGEAVVEGEFRSAAEKISALRIVSEVVGVTTVTDNSSVRRTGAEGGIAETSPRAG